MTKDKTKIALVTGSSRGIGKNTALTVAKKGVGVPDDIGGVIASLLEENKWVNAQRIEVSGGMFL
ncbi:MAG: hypothetical protein V7L01_24375 [Nostoc sp.]|uniref:hypothetical protein n=1 Tax=Nostoc sp. TaxID=1180 RepID=UPI002FF45592